MFVRAPAEGFPGFLSACYLLLANPLCSWLALTLLGLGGSCGCHRGYTGRFLVHLLVRMLTLLLGRELWLLKAGLRLLLVLLFAQVVRNLPNLSYAGRVSGRVVSAH